MGDSCLFSYLVHLETDVVQELDLTSESDSSESNGGDFQDEVSVQLASSCSELQTDPAGEGSTDTIQKKAQSLMDVLKCPQPSSLARKQVITKTILQLASAAVRAQTTERLLLVLSHNSERKL